jgi:DNA-3-methyladenine glycosylase
MFGPPGHAYVYLVYGMYQCLNVVTGPEGQASAVLVRAVEPIAGLEAMRAERLARLRPVGGAGADMASVRASIPADDRLAAGPGLVGVAFSITRADDGADLCDPASDLRLEMGSGGEQELVAGPRRGIGYAAEPWLGKPWRYCLAASPSISRGRSRLPRTPATRSSADGSRG